MAKIHIHAGDFGKGKGLIQFTRNGNPRLTPPLAPGKFSWTGYGKPVTVCLFELEEIDTGVRAHTGKTLAWGAVGEMIMGLAGAVVGAIIGGRQATITFTAKFHDGKCMLATADIQTYGKLTALLP